MARLIRSLSSTSHPAASADWLPVKRCNSSRPIALMMHSLLLCSKCCELWLLGLAVLTRKSAQISLRATTALHDWNSLKQERITKHSSNT